MRKNVLFGAVLLLSLTGSFAVSAQNQVTREDINSAAASGTMSEEELCELERKFDEVQAGNDTDEVTVIYEWGIDPCVNAALDRKYGNKAEPEVLDTSNKGASVKAPVEE